MINGNHFKNSNFGISVLKSALFSLIGILVVTAFADQSIGQDRKFDPKQYLTGLDKDKNGRLEPSEMVGRTRDHLKGLGFDTDKSLSIEKILEKVDKNRRKDEKSRSRSDDSDSDSRRRTDLKVPGFGASEGSNPVQGFGLTDVKPASANFSDSVLRQVDETLERHDRNRDGILDSREIKKAKWGNPRPEESDSNGDGKLSRTELSNRYYAREQSRRDIEEGSRSKEKEKTTSSSRDRGRFGSSSNSSGSSYRRRPTTSSYRSSSNSKTTSSSSSKKVDREKYMKYAESLVKNYDKNEDGKLDKNEVKQMRRPPVGADTNKDGFISKDELVDSLSGVNKNKEEKPGKKEGDSKEKSRAKSSGTSKYRSKSTSGSFSGLDANEDNRIEMHEFTDDWDAKKVEEFYEKDKNRDGVITAKEWKSK